MDNSDCRVAHKPHRAPLRWILAVKFHTKRRGTIPKQQWFAYLLKISPTVIDNIGFFGNLYGATLDMIEIGAKCGDNALPAALAYFAFASIFWWLAAVIGTVTFGLGLLLGLMLNAIIEFLIKPAILSECIKS